MVLVVADHWYAGADGATLALQQARFVSGLASPSLGRPVIASFGRGTSPLLFNLPPSSLSSLNNDVQLLQSDNSLLSLSVAQSRLQSYFSSTHLAPFDPPTPGSHGRPSWTWISRFRSLPQVHSIVNKSKLAILLQLSPKSAPSALEYSLANSQALTPRLPPTFQTRHTPCSLGEHFQADWLFAEQHLIISSIYAARYAAFL